jgi:hypothetical protein
VDVPWQEIALEVIHPADAFTEGAVRAAAHAAQLQRGLRAPQPRGA